MSQGLGLGQVVDGDDVDVGIVQRSAINVASDTSETVDTYFDSHVASV